MQQFHGIAQRPKCSSFSFDLGFRHLSLYFQPPRVQKKTPVKSKDSSFHSKPFGDEQKPETRSFSSSKQSNRKEEESASGWNTEEGDWGGGDWGEMDDNDTPSNEADSAAVKAREREAKKAELKRKQEERRQQREQTMKERKGKGGGAMKLGGVKKVAKDSFDQLLQV